MFKPTAIVLSRFSLLFAALTLAACGGGGGGGGGGSGGSGGGDGSGATATAVKPGIFDTTVEGATDPEAFTLLSPSGDYAIFSDGLAGTFGTLTFNSDDTLTGSGKNVFLDGSWKSIDGSMSGSVLSTEKFTATFTENTAGATAGSKVTAVRSNEISDIPVTLDDLAETYSLSSSDPDTGVVTQTTAVTIFADGRVNGSQTITGSAPDEGCQINGEIAIPNPAYNLFEGNLSLTNCSNTDAATSEQRNGEYPIIGILQVTPQKAKELVFVGTNDQVIFLFIGVQ